jgi:hypothetical protein
MVPIDQSYEYYRLRHCHELSRALVAKTKERRHQHLRAAVRYSDLASDLRVQQRREATRR